MGKGKEWSPAEAWKEKMAAASRASKPPKKELWSTCCKVRAVRFNNGPLVCEQCLRPVKEV